MFNLVYNVTTIDYYSYSPFLVGSIEDNRNCVVGGKSTLFGFTVGCRGYLWVGKCA